MKLFLKAKDAENEVLRKNIRSSKLEESEYNCKILMEENIRLR